MLFDTHCHLDYLQKDGNLNDIIDNANNAGINKIVTISTLVKKFNELDEITRKYNNIWCTVGTHPDKVADDIFNIDCVSELCKQNNKIVGIGETGLDLYHPDNPPLKLQIDFLEKHIFVAKRFNLPIIFHSRAAEIQSLEILKSSQDGNLSCVMHCFTGSYEFAKQCLDLGFYISISGIVTFKNAHEIQEMVKKIPIDRLVIETDAPFLAPMPMRGKQNEPAFLAHTARFLSDMLNIDFEELSSQIWQNSHKLFNRIQYS